VQKAEEIIDKNNIEEKNELHNNYTKIFNDSKIDNPFGCGSSEETRDRIGHRQRLRTQSSQSREQVDSKATCRQNHATILSSPNPKPNFVFFLSLPIAKGRNNSHFSFHLHLPNRCNKQTLEQYQRPKSLTSADSPN
jgi:hypothetical protein